MQLLVNDKMYFAERNKTYEYYSALFQCIP